MDVITDPCSVHSQTGQTLTWVKEYDCLEASELWIINLNFSQRLHKFVQNSGHHTTDLQFLGVTRQDEIIAQQQDIGERKWATSQA